MEEDLLIDQTTMDHQTEALVTRSLLVNVDTADSTITTIIAIQSYHSRKFSRSPCDPQMQLRKS